MKEYVVATRHNSQDSSFIVEDKFKLAFSAAKMRYPTIREDFGRRAIFKMFERIRSNAAKSYGRESFHDMKSAVITLIEVYGKDHRSEYHSLIIRYNHLGGFIEAKRVPKNN
jgi:hypothetical protein